MSQEPMTQERLNAIQTRVDSATSGPWGCYGDGAHEVFDAGEYSDGDPGEVVAAVIDKLSDAVFIAEAREDIPALLAEIDRLRGQLADARVNITDSMVDRAAREIYHQLSGAYGDFCTPSVDQARAVVAAALGGGDDA